MTAPTCPPPVLRHPERTIGRRVFDFSRQLVLMAIVNCTRDSFYDRGATFGFEHAVAAALEAARAGADWVDIGAVPFSPDAADVSEAEEIDRIESVVRCVAAASDVVISVDTFRPEVARRALAAGASVVNDTSGLRNPELAELVGGTRATLVITHSLARPREHLRRPTYGDVVDEVRAFLVSRVELALSLGVPEDRIVIDPGHDLNKNTLHSIELTRRLHEIASIGLPVLAAVSNKDFIGEATGRGRADRREASLAAAVVCALQGARVLRMHDVAGVRAAADLVEVLLGFREPAYLRHNQD
ncbi:MAG TPA: dihydropteroate synthase [Propionibacteriaceae bacterium]|nr:dihydropteroate synthase [Propionibacteriaceae bacterium]